jgi:Uncharacterized protein conserved in bacteria
MMFTMQEPYYGIILSSMERIPDERIGTIGVAKYGNVFRLIYNPKFLEPLNVDTILSLLKHEVLHLAFNHFTLFDNTGISHKERHIRNCAEDLEVNSYLDRSKIQKEAGGVFAEDLGLEKRLGTREYYRILIGNDQQQQQQQAQQPQQACNGGQGGGSGSSGDSGDNHQQDQNQQQNQNQNPPQNNNQGQGQGQGNGSSDGLSQKEKEDLERLLHGNKTFDDHSMWPKDMSESEKEQLTQAVEQMLVFAAEEVEKAQGTIPGELVGKIEQIRKKPKPVTDWKRHFRRYMGNEFTEFLRKSKKRPSRRFEDAAGNKHRRKSRILVAIDTSGSVSMPEYLEFFGQIATLSQTADFHVVECDTRIQYEYEFYRKPNETLHGGGGTSFQPPIDLYLKHQREYDALVYFTDGYAGIPKNTPKDTLWVISSEGDKNRDKYRVNGASVVFIPSKK